MSKDQESKEPEGFDFGLLAERWFLSSGHLSKGTRKKYREALDNYWLPALAGKDIRSIKYSDLGVLVGSIAWTSAKTRNNNLIPLRQVFAMAFDDGLIDRDPTRRIKNAKIQRALPDPLTPDEVGRILDYMRKAYPREVVRYFEFALFSGLRIEEIIEIQWKDVNLDPTEPRLLVRRARVLGEVKPTKTFKERMVNLNDFAACVLHAQQTETGRRVGYVFHNPITNQPWNTNGKAQRIRYWNPALDRLGIRHRVTNTTRHSYATLMLLGGNNPAYAAAQMGHSQQIFLNVYSRWIDSDAQKREREKTNRFIGESFSPPLQHADIRAFGYKPSPS